MRGIRETAFYWERNGVLLIEKGRFSLTDWQAGFQRVTFSLVAGYGLKGQEVRSKVKTTTWFAKTTPTFVKTTS